MLSEDIIRMNNAEKLTYSDIYSILAHYIPDALLYFADGWQRMPAGRNAAEVQRMLNNNALYWERHKNPMLGWIMTKAAETIQEAQ